MKSTAVRQYRMGARAEAAARTARAILRATVELWRERPLDDITLEAIAERADVSVRTVIRRFGSRNGVIAACIESDAGEVRAGRDQAPVGDTGAAVDVLLAHYERDGDAVLRTLALEGKMPAVDAILEVGRRSHREWCARVFSPYLPTAAAAHDARLDAFVAATDVYVWKLLRRDLGRTAEETGHAIRALVEGLSKLPNHQP